MDVSENGAQTHMGFCLSDLEPTDHGPDSIGELPALALAEQKVTVMEAICASPCLITLICMAENNVRQEAHMARHRFGARGNA